MKKYTEMTREELQELYNGLQKEYAQIQSRNLSLDMSRGKPGKEQLDLSEDMLHCIKDSADCMIDGIDARNYGVLDGLPSIKKMFAELLGVDDSMVIVGGNSSLTMMYDTVARAMTHGVYGSVKPWGKQEGLKFLCPSPGYDRHFAITEFFGFELITVPMTEDGPDMDVVEKLVAQDASIKGIWCVPKYSNPDGIVYSDETVRRLAALKPAADDFRIFYDNAYVVHHLTDEEIEIPEIFSLAREYGNEDMIFEFASTSKICYPGAGVACMVASKANVEFIKKQMFYQTIGPDKINELRHIKYFKDVAGIKAHMRKHAQVLGPRFDVVTDTLERELSGLDVGCWITPKGGYFVSFNAMAGCAKRIVVLMKEAGVVMTGAGATFPYKKDPQDSNIRIAPSFPSVEDLQMAMDVFCVCVKLAAIEKLLA